MFNKAYKCYKYCKSNVEIYYVYTHREIDSQSCLIKPNFGCNYTSFRIDFARNLILFVAKM